MRQWAQKKKKANISSLLLGFVLFPVDPTILRLSNFSKGIYRFTKDLLQLELASPPLASLPYPSSIVSPLRPAAWDRALSPIPDKAFTSFLLRGLTEGFRIGFERGAHLVPTRRNRSSAYERPDVISEYLAREVDLGRMTPYYRHLHWPLHSCSSAPSG